MSTIYLDRNVVLDAYLCRNKHISAAILYRKNIGDTFPYSPAHVEEIVGAKRIHEVQDAKNQLDFLNELSCGIAFCPTPTNDILMQFYDIEECRKNVEDGEGYNSTEFAVQLELLRLEKYKNLIAKDASIWDSIRQEVAKCSWKNVFSNQHISQCIVHLALVNNFRINMSTSRGKENTIEVLYNVLDLFGFKKEENERRVDNRMHDISHTVYATSADIFVTNDEKLYNKAKAIYNYTSIKTQVMFIDEFIAQTHIV